MTDKKIAAAYVHYDDSRRIGQVSLRDERAEAFVNEIWAINKAAKEGNLTQPFITIDSVDGNGTRMIPVSRIIEISIEYKS